MVLGFPHRAGRYRPVGSPLSSPVRWSCRYMEGFLIRGRDLSLSGRRWLPEPQPISNQPVLCFPHRARRCRLGGAPFASPIYCNWRCVEGSSDRGMRPYPPRVALAPRNPANELLAIEVGVSTPCAAVSTRETVALVPGLLESEICGRFSNPGMILYPLRVSLAP